MPDFEKKRRKKKKRRKRGTELVSPQCTLVKSTKQQHTMMLRPRRKTGTPLHPNICGFCGFPPLDGCGLNDDDAV
ncbi:hypothetical protein PoB_005648600 [Plakobranchus ocellatus]|uniref:Uncharacterized protein n=1 Tax=Plakobranchus ocellatus TaxID=259542 RepID=A0AAV4C3R2_9GAST|nr:hypothetical protein PoB_005648600 [Plakobranchus ocellatus]